MIDLFLVVLSELVFQCSILCDFHEYLLIRTYEKNKTLSTDKFILFNLNVLHGLF